MIVVVIVNVCSLICIVLLVFRCSVLSSIGLVYMVLGVGIVVVFCVVVVLVGRILIVLCSGYLGDMVFMVVRCDGVVLVVCLFVVVVIMFGKMVVVVVCRLSVWVCWLNDGLIG